jgi:hypothetical protein
VRALAPLPGEHPYLQPTQPATGTGGLTADVRDALRSALSAPIMVKPAPEARLDTPVTQRPAWLDSIKPPSWVSEMMTQREAAMPTFPEIQVNTGSLDSIPATFASVFDAGAATLGGAGISAADAFVNGISGAGASVGLNAASAFAASISGLSVPVRVTGLPGGADTGAQKPND